ncbi:Protein of unknown function DUF2268, Zn-dependent protease-related protein (plasmid) [Deinococcus proteolyticus MRP]|uniref:DUF2268 domain-containing protein n=1 Tax=Deinococcus proteolyticus (strain ATCC 35074 / DSM 20540 / JCM 6276 / NBRC 101906 / NCIMB 13154 / VKM Ac-1939 / CCM 2703 / MRP) TaxID=693977 RepID=F0RR46_DEIPM|nr:DUF2268 domain-containing putative Zn-dependent protease [Deinococcus proteolyticus]ADY27755.1 Protein of unknown function DUF2268, Zn-dependent protease-related protein [Deinococcus proteolyticus MRP]
MKIIEVNTLPALRQVLLAPAEQQDELFRMLVMEPMRPTWEPMLAYMPHDPSDPSLSAARLIHLYRPELGAERGLRALEQLERAQVFEVNRRVLAEAMDALHPDAHEGLSPDITLTLALMDPDGPMKEGYVGMGNTPGWVGLYIWPRNENWLKLPAITAHEFNHNIRFQQPDWTFPMTLGAYLVAEGLGETFAAELHGESSLGPWTTDLQEETLRQLAPRYEELLLDNDFTQVRGYIFGDLPPEEFGAFAVPHVGVPPYAGYALGYHIVKDFLRRTGISAAEATYLPWRDIVNGSGWMRVP